jgi:osmotically-inducible protein OsmY
MSRRNPLLFLVGAGLGAAVMYFLDPNRGARRRHVAVDRAGRALRERARELHDARRNVANRAAGVVREAKRQMQVCTVDDEILVARVRAELGHRVDSARAIEVVADQGCVTLSGSALVHEIDVAEKTVKRVPGVCGVNNELVPIELTLD